MAAEAPGRSAATGPQRPDVRAATNGLCSYGRQLEDTLASFAEMLERHSASLHNIQEDVRTRCFTSDLEELRGVVESRFDRLERRMASLESALVVRRPGTSQLDDTTATHTSMPIGEYVAMQQAAIDRLGAEVGQRPTITEAEGMVNASAAALSERLNQLDKDKAAAAHVRSMQVTQQETIAQLRAAEATLQIKMDRVDLRQLETAVQAIRDFDAFRDNVQATLTGQEQQNRDLEEALKAESDTLGQLQGMVTRIAQDLTQFSQRKELQPLQEGLAEVRAAVATKASEDHAQESAAALQDLSRRLEEAMASVHSTLESHSDRFDVVTRSVKENAAIGALGERLDSTLTMVESRLTQMEADVNSKAWVSSVETAEQQLVAMAARNEDLQRQVDIALRFVEWFSRRGEAYEHNAAAIERHMKDLALTAHSRRAGVPHCDTAGGATCHGGAGCKCGCGGGGGAAGSAREPATVSGHRHHGPGTGAAQQRHTHAHASFAHSSGHTHAHAHR